MYNSYSASPPPLSQSTQATSNLLNTNMNLNINNNMVKKNNMNMYKYGNNYNYENDIKLTKFPSNDSINHYIKTTSLKNSLDESKNLIYNNKTNTPLRAIKSNDNISLSKNSFNNEDYEKPIFSNDEKKIIFNHDEDVVNKICDLCLKRQGSFELLYCQHVLCDKCIQNEKLYNKEGQIMKCFCEEIVHYMKYIHDNKSIKNNKKENQNNENNDQISNKSNSIPVFNGNMYNILTLDRIFPVPTTYLPVVKLSNIPWDLSQKDVLAFFYPLKIPSAHESPYYTQGIHIIMNRTSGKTFSDAYIEFITVEDANTAIETRNKTILKGRIVTISKSSQEELMKSLFPSWTGNYSKDKVLNHNSNPSVPATPINSASITMGTGIIYGSMNTNYARDGCFLTRDEVSAILLVCKNYKLHFSRKCAERPFENIISIVSKIPWHIPNIINTLHRDHIFELLKLSLESLKTHLSKEYINISPTLMNRLIRSGLCCPGFTEKQKNMILNFSDHGCPKDMELFIYKIDKYNDKKELNTINQSFVTDSISSAYPSPPNSLKSISSSSSSSSSTSFKTKSTSIISTNTSNNITTIENNIPKHLDNDDDNSLIKESLIPSNDSSNNLINKNLTPKNSFNTNNNNNNDNDNENNTNKNILNETIIANDYTFYESSGKPLSLENFKLINDDKQDENKKGSISSPLEFNLTENNVEEKILIDNINNVLLNNNYNNEASINSNNNNYKSNIKSNNGLANYPINNMPNIPHLNKTTTHSQTNYDYSILTTPPPQISNYPSFSTSYLTPSYQTPSHLFNNNSNRKSISSSIPITSHKPIIQPPLLPFNVNDNFSIQNNNQIQNNNSYLPQLTTFNPIINSNFSIPKPNDIISPVGKINPFLNSFPPNETNKNPNFTPFITSERLINKNLQIRQNQIQNYPNKFNENNSTNQNSSFKPNSITTTTSETIPSISSINAITPTKILNEILTLPEHSDEEEIKNISSNTTTTTTTTFTTTKKDDISNDSIEQDLITTINSNSTKNDISNNNIEQYLSTVDSNINLNLNLNSNSNSIKALQSIIQDLVHKCMKYDEQLKEALEYNKQLENKIIKLETNNEKNEDNNNEDNEKKEFETNKDFPSPSLSSISSNSK